MPLQYIGGIHNLVGCLRGENGCFPDEEVEHALKVGERALAEIYLGHSQRTLDFVRALLFAMLADLGHLAGLPAAFLMMYSCTSCIA